MIQKLDLHIGSPRLVFMVFKIPNLHVSEARGHLLLMAQGILDFFISCKIKLVALG